MTNANQGQVKQLRRKRSTVFAIIVLILAILIFISLLWFKPRSTPLKMEEKQWPVHVATIHYGKYTPSIVLYGKVEAIPATKLSAETNGTIKQLMTKVGEQVTAGQLLVVLGQRTKKAVVAERRAAITELQARITQEQQLYENDINALIHEQALLQLKQQAVEREQALQKKRLAIKARLDEAKELVHQTELAVKQRQLSITSFKSRLAILQAQLTQAQARLRQAEIDLSRTRIYAPYAGKITNIAGAIGQRVNAGGVLVEMYPQHGLEVRAQVPQKYLVNFLQAEQQQQQLTAFIKNHLGSIAQLSFIRLAKHVVDGHTGVAAYFAIKQESHSLYLNQHIHLTINLAPLKHVISVPEQAVYRQQWLYKVEHNRMQRIAITIVGQHVTANDEVNLLIRSKQLKPGDQYVMTHLPNARSGLIIKPITTNAVEQLS